MIRIHPLVHRLATFCGSGSCERFPCSARFCGITGTFSLNVAVLHIPETNSVDAMGSYAPCRASISQMTPTSVESACYSVGIVGTIRPELTREETGCEFARDKNARHEPVS